MYHSSPCCLISSLGFVRCWGGLLAVSGLPLAAGPCRRNTGIKGLSHHTHPWFLSFEIRSLWPRPASVIFWPPALSRLKWLDFEHLRSFSVSELLSPSVLLPLGLWGGFKRVQEGNSAFCCLLSVSKPWLLANHSAHSEAWVCFPWVIFSTYDLVLRKPKL